MNTTIESVKRELNARAEELGRLERAYPISKGYPKQYARYCKLVEEVTLLQEELEELERQ